MKSSDVDILIIPGWGNSGPDHWQTRWEDKLSTARRVAQDDWERPVRDVWVERIVAETLQAQRPVLYVAHSLGVHALVHAAPRLADRPVAGAFLVAPPSERAVGAIAAIDPAFLPVPADPLPFPSVVVASRNDPMADYEEAGDLANGWGSALSDAGESGHINTDSGHGPWPEGLMRLAGFLKALG